MTSRDTVPPNWENVPSGIHAIHYRCLDYEAGYTHDLPNNLAAETIVTWNADSGDLRMVKIPQTRLGKIRVQWLFLHCNPHSLSFSSQHSADFQYISPQEDRPGQQFSIRSFWCCALCVLGERKGINILIHIVYPGKRAPRLRVR